MRATTSDRSEGGSKGNAIVGVLVNQRQSEDIVFVQKTGTLKLVLRGDKPTEEELESVEGVLARDGEKKDSQPYARKEKKQFEKMIIWVGNDYETVTFEPGGVPKAFGGDPSPQGSSQKDNGSSNKADYGESEVLEEINNEYEEDQYPAQ